MISLVRSATVGPLAALEGVDLLNEDGTLSVKNVKRKGQEITHALQSEVTEGMDKLFQAAANAGVMSSSVLQDAIMAVKNIVGMRAALEG